MRFASFIAVAIAAANSAVGLGINCHGDTKCGIAYLSGGRLSQLGTVIKKIDDTRKYENGDDIACVEIDSVNFKGPFKSTLCAWIENYDDTVTGAEIKAAFQELLDHGCAICGAVPLLYAKGVDDINKGELNVDLVDSLPEGCKANEPCSAA
ncbi:killer toxin [Trichoderma longibrachiatum]|uniref:Killer toxin n=1 Tax=Trichoderma longibrachiatum ATCC 18648 TaxID=983965 RepID=A0A2T4BWJ5_TRILO|nr:killer toxin [Trichoderma longibrachiatum ATCC 18648]